MSHAPEYRHWKYCPHWPTAMILPFSAGMYEYWIDNDVLGLLLFSVAALVGIHWSIYHKCKEGHGDDR